MIRIEVAYALPERQAIIELEVDDHCTVRTAITHSGIQRDFPEIDPQTAKCGIFGTPVADPARQLVREGERIEIYRPLLIDPKAVRKQRADASKKARRSR